MNDPIFSSYQLGSGNPMPSVTGNKGVRPLQHFELAVLMLVSSLGTQAYPAEIARRLTVTLERHVALAQVFIALERMENRGLVSSQESEPEQVRGGRRRRIFRLEASGAHLLSESAATYNRMSSQLSGCMENPNAKDEPTLVPSPT